MCLLYKLLDQELLVSRSGKFPIGLFLRTVIEKEFNFIGRMEAAERTKFFVKLHVHS